MLVKKSIKNLLKSIVYIVLFSHTGYSYMAQMPNRLQQCAPEMSFNGMQIMYDNATKVIYTPHGLFFDLINAGKIFYTKILQVEHKRIAKLINQEHMTDGSFRCHYEMHLNPLQFVATVNPHKPLPQPPVTAPGQPMTAPGQPQVNPGVAVPQHTPYPQYAPMQALPAMPMPAPQ